jgi:hypothetical protein
MVEVQTVEALSPCDSCGWEASRRGTLSVLASISNPEIFSHIISTPGT